MIQYSMDLEAYNNMISIIKIKNVEELVIHLGVKEYLVNLKKTFLKIYSKNNQMVKLKSKGILDFYFIDMGTIIVAGKFYMGKEEFVNIVRNIYEDFQYVKLIETNSFISTRFILVLNQSNMFERAITELHDEKNKYKDFIICDLCSDKKAEIEFELKMLNIIYWAIQNDAVIPYYQGIYNNRKKFIEKYEVLIRIKDQDGNIYMPNLFLNIAKKYNIHTKLSEIFIRKVLMEVDKKEIDISINISAYDLNSIEFRDYLSKLLKQRKSKKSLIIEILEDENFRDYNRLDNLKKLLSDIKSYEIKVAIDDFGVECSNLFELLSEIHIDYIKVDGRIISSLNKSPSNKVILEAIIFLAKKLNLNIIAEHVENRKIQEIIEHYDIDYSQGYYFSKPITHDMF